MKCTCAPPKTVCEAVVKICPAGADPDHDIGLARQAVRRQRPGRADGAQVRRMIMRERSLAAWVSPTGIPVISTSCRSALVARHR